MKITRLKLPLFIWSLSGACGLTPTIHTGHRWKSYASQHIEQDGGWFIIWAVGLAKPTTTR